MTQKEIEAQVEEWLDDRWDILLSTDRKADEIYYNGAIDAIMRLGYSWIRDRNGRHTIIKQK